MHETSWTGRIILSLIVVIVVGVVVLGYVGSMRSPQQQHYDQTVVIPPA